MTEQAISNRHESGEAAAQPKLTDGQRFRQAARYHGLALLAAITLWGAADAWALADDLLLARLIALANAVVAGIVLSTIFHEWGHFAGARLARAYSPMVRKPVNAFIFGFSFEKNSREQFLSMSLGGPIANWTLVFLVAALVPLDNPGRCLLFAVVLAQAVSVVVFEGPIIARTLQGTPPQQSLDAGLANGSQERARYVGIAVGVATWLLLI